MTSAQINTSTIADAIAITQGRYPSSSPTQAHSANGGVIKFEDPISTSLSSTPTTQKSGMYEASSLPVHKVDTNPSTLPGQKVGVSGVASSNQYPGHKASVSATISPAFPQVDPSLTRFSGHKIPVRSQPQDGSTRLFDIVAVSALKETNSADSADCYEWVWVDESGNEISKRTDSKLEAMELLVKDHENYEKEKNPSSQEGSAEFGRKGRRAAQVVKRAPQDTNPSATSTSHASSSVSGTSHDPSTSNHLPTNSTADFSSAISTTTKPVSSVPGSLLTTYPVTSLAASATEGLHDSRRAPNDFHPFNHAGLIASIVLIVIGLSTISYVAIYLYRNRQKKNKEAQAKINQHEPSFSMYNAPSRYNSIKDDDMYGHEVAHLGYQASSDDTMAPRLNRLYSIQAAFAKNKKISQLAQHENRV